MKFNKARYRKPNSAPQNINALHLNEMLIYTKQEEVSNLHSLNLYPNSSELIDAISNTFNIHQQNIVIDNGSSAILKNIFLIILSDLGKKPVLLPNPSWSFYIDFLEFLEIDFYTFDLEMSERDFYYNGNTIQEKIRFYDIGYVLITSPNNPTGNDIGMDDFLKLALSNPNVMFILDRAYFGFVDNNFDKEVVEKLLKLENIIIIYSFSKFYGLASARVGFCLSHYKNIQKINNLTPTFGVSSISCSLAKNRMLDKGYFLKVQESYIQICNYLNKQKFKNFTIYNTKANFFLIKIRKHSVDYVYGNLLSNGFLVKIEKIFSEDFLRITMADFGTMERFFNILSRIDSE